MNGDLVRARERGLSRPQILGILNVTPDSFSDGGRYTGTDAAIAQAEALREAGADLIDVGGESTRPGAARVPEDEERERVLPIVRALVDRGIPVSVDTMNSRTAAASAEAGANLINDVSGGLADPEMYRTIAATGIHYVAMHWRGSADADAQYDDVVTDVRNHLKLRVAEMLVWGIKPDRIVLDPGLGFAKRGEHNWQLLGRMRELASLGYPLLVGASRKRFLGALLPDEASVEQRDEPTAHVSALAAAAGAWAVRVHDVRSTRLALDVWEQWERGAHR